MSIHEFVKFVHRSGDFPPGFAPVHAPAVRPSPRAAGAPIRAME